MSPEGSEREYLFSDTIRKIDVPDEASLLAWITAEAEEVAGGPVENIVYERDNAYYADSGNYDACRMTVRVWGRPVERDHADRAADWLREHPGLTPAHGGRVFRLEQNPDA